MNLYYIYLFLFTLCSIFYFLLYSFLSFLITFNNFLSHYSPIYYTYFLGTRGPADPLLLLYCYSLISLLIMHYPHIYYSTILMTFLQTINIIYKNSISTHKTLVLTTYNFLCKNHSMPSTMIINLLHTLFILYYHTYCLLVTTWLTVLIYSLIYHLINIHLLSYLFIHDYFTKHSNFILLPNS